MKQKSTDQLIADVLALSLEVRHHLEDRRRHLTPRQIEALSSAIAALANYFAVWKAHEEAAKRAVGRKSSRVVVTPASTKLRRKR
jgi:hypothetical protein